MWRQSLPTMMMMMTSPFCFSNCSNGIVHVWFRRCVCEWVCVSFVFASYSLGHHVSNRIKYLNCFKHHCKCLHISQNSYLCLLFQFLQCVVFNKSFEPYRVCVRACAHLIFDVHHLFCLTHCHSVSLCRPLSLCVHSNQFNLIRNWKGNENKMAKLRCTILIAQSIYVCVLLLLNHPYCQYMRANTFYGQAHSLLRCVCIFSSLWMRYKSSGEIRKKAKLESEMGACNISTTTTTTTTSSSSTKMCDNVDEKIVNDDSGNRTENFSCASNRKTNVIIIPWCSIKCSQYHIESNVFAIWEKSSSSSSARRLRLL